MLSKKFQRTKCKVTFSLPESAASAPSRVYLVGDFNAWDEQATPMAYKAGKYSATLDLALNQTYQYRYLIDGQDWRTDADADEFAPNPFHSDNSVVKTYAN